MKKNILILLFILTGTFAYSQNVGIGTNTPNASAVLDASSTTQGFLPPRMTYAQRNAIANPAAGLIVYCTDCNGGAGEMNYYNGNTWMNMTIGTASNVVAILPSVTICNQIWTTKNLDVSIYRNGDPIPNVTDAATWTTLTTGAYCYYNNDSATYAATYGKLYNWYAVNDTRGLAPIGWHVPSDTEWTRLETCLGGLTLAGGAMKDVGLTHWQSPNTDATNISGFTGLPGGYRNTVGIFNSIGYNGFWFSSTENLTTDAVMLRNLNFSRSNLSQFSSIHTLGYSVRCVRD